MNPRLVYRSGMYMSGHLSAHTFCWPFGAMQAHSASVPPVQLSVHLLYFHATSFEKIYVILAFGTNIIIY